MYSVSKESAVGLPLALKPLTTGTPGAARVPWGRLLLGNGVKESVQKNGRMACACGRPNLLTCSLVADAMMSR